LRKDSKQTILIEKREDPDITHHILIEDRETSFKESALETKHSTF
jgi:hypothetical protein